MHLQSVPAAIVLAALAAAAAPARAEGTAGSDELAPVLVTGTQDPDKSTPTQPDLATARERIERTAGGANVVDSARYRGGRVATLSDALGYSPGVTVQPRFGAEEARLSIRGSGAQRTFHGRGLRLMQDGVPLNLTDGSFDFQAVEALTARYVEVWRGANALQHGADTLGGAINFVSPNGYNADLLNLRGEAGSFGYRRGLVSGGDVLGAIDGYVAASAYRSQGFRRHAKQDTRRAFANIGAVLGPAVESRLYVGWVESDSELPGSLTRAQLRADPRQANPGNVSGNQKRDIDWLRVSNKTVWRIDAARRLEAFAFVNRKTLFHPIFQVLDQTSDDAGIELRYVSDAPVGGRRNRLVLGVSPGVGHTGEDRWVNSGGERGSRTNRSEQFSQRFVVYGENQHFVRPRLALSVGAQAARATRKLTDLYVSGVGSDTASESFDLRYRGFSPKLGLLWQAAEDRQWFANVSRSFEPPSFGELAGGVSPVLNRAQRATTFEVGTRGRDAALGVEWDVAAYHGRYRDELLQVGTNVANAPITINAARTVHSGLELGAGSADPERPLSWRVALNAQRLRLDGDPNFGDNRLPGLPRAQARAELGWRFGPGLLAAAHVEAASGYPIDFANSFHADRYAIWGLRLRQAVSPAWSWFVEGRNLSDRAYAATTGIVRNAGGNDAAQFLPGDGRALYAGIEFRL